MLNSERLSLLIFVTLGQDISVGGKGGRNKAEDTRLFENKKVVDTDKSIQI